MITKIEVLKFSLSAKEHKSLNFRINFLLESTKVNSQKLNFLLERRDYFLPFELRLSAKEHKRFNSKIDTLLKSTRVNL